MRFLNKVEKLADDLLADLPPELLEEAREHVGQMLARKFSVNTPVNHDLREVDGAEASPSQPAPSGESWRGAAQIGQRDFPAENDGSESFCVPKNGTQSGSEAPSDEALYEEYKRQIKRVMRLKQDGGTSYDEAFAETARELGEFDEWKAKRLKT
jgi:hypothetical protein